MWVAMAAVAQAHASSNVVVGLLQATWVTLLWYASVPRPDMLAQLHASGQLQSLLLKYMQAAYERMQAAMQVLATAAAA